MAAAAKLRWPNVATSAVIVMAEAAKQKAVHRPYRLTGVPVRRNRIRPASATQGTESVKMMLVPAGAPSLPTWNSGNCHASR
jgi:hypothetical protein